MMKDEETGVGYLDADDESHSQKEDGRTYRAILMDYIRKIANAAGSEMRGGYWQVKSEIAGNGIQQQTKFWIPDTREIFCNAVSFLYDLLYPHIKRHAPKNVDYRKSIQNVQDEIERLYKDILLKTEIDDTELLSTDYYSDNTKRLIDEYKLKNVHLHKKLFRMLNEFMDEYDYFAGEKSITDWGMPTMKTPDIVKEG